MGGGERVEQSVVVGVGGIADGGSRTVGSCGGGGYC